MIILYDENETSFGTLGIGVLKDAISCIVLEELNGSFELELVYPVTGNYYKDISLRKIIYVKPNKYDTPQAFRIDTISKPFNGKVSITANHLSYDLSGYIVEPLDEEAIGIQDAFTKINGKILNNSDFPFTFNTDITNTESKFNIQVPASVRSILAGNEGSLLDVFGGEYKFNNYSINLLRKRGEDRGFSVRYGKNLTDIKQEIKSDKLYTDIYPYYYRIVTVTNTSVDKVYQQLYIRTAGEGEEPIEPFTAQWLSLKTDGSSFTPIIKNTPVQIATEGEYYQKIYIWTDVEQPNGSTITRYLEVNSTDYPPNIPAPENSTTESTEMVTLTNKTIPIQGRETILPKRILPLDLTQYFEDKPTEQELTDKANDYISNNKIGTVSETVEASFIRINDKSINEAICLLGDTVKVYFSEIGVNSSLQVISTRYDAITDNYTDIGLGTKKSNFSDNAVSVGDDISSLNNDANYTDEIKVGDLIAKTITADYIEGTNAKFTNAQITALHSDNIIVDGIIQAAEGSVDELVAKLLIADNSAVKEQLTVGENLVVNGEVNIKSGSIAIIDDSNVDFTIAYINPGSEDFSNTWLTSDKNHEDIIVPNSEKYPADTIFKVYDKHELWTQDYYIWNVERSAYSIYFPPEIETAFEVDKSGKLYAKEAEIEGTIIATKGQIKSEINVNDNFIVNEFGDVQAHSLTLTGTLSPSASYDVSTYDNTIIGYDAIVSAPIHEENGYINYTGTKIEVESINITGNRNPEYQDINEVVLKTSRTANFGKLSLGNNATTVDFTAETAMETLTGGLRIFSLYQDTDPNVKNPVIENVPDNPSNISVTFKIKISGDYIDDILYDYPPRYTFVLGIDSTVVYSNGTEQLLYGNVSYTFEINETNIGQKMYDSEGHAYYIAYISTKVKNKAGNLPIASYTNNSTSLRPPSFNLVRLKPADENAKPILKISAESILPDENSEMDLGSENYHLKDIYSETNTSSSYKVRGVKGTGGSVVNTLQKVYCKTIHVAAESSNSFITPEGYFNTIEGVVATAKHIDGKWGAYNLTVSWSKHAKFNYWGIYAYNEVNEDYDICVMVVGT